MDDVVLEEADELLELLRLAETEGVQYEVAATFIDEIRRGATVKTACYVAMREWDI